MPVYKVTHASDPNWYVFAPTIRQAIEAYEEASGNTQETESVERAGDRFVTWHDHRPTPPVREQSIQEREALLQGLDMIPKLEQGILAHVRRELTDLAAKELGGVIFREAQKKPRACRDYGEAVNKWLRTALDRVCPEEHVTPPAQEAEEPPDTSSPAPRG